jgi:multidrug efflux pump subunit AcrA (membrane-fusion protein)
MKNRNKYLFWIMSALVGVLVLWLAVRIVPPTSLESGQQEEKHEERGHEEEGVLEIRDAALFESGVSLDTVRSRRLAVRLPLQGRIVLNEDRAVHVHPRFPGVILEVRKQLGSRVRKGEVLAVIESNENLQPYSVISRMDGTVVGRHAAVGESVSADDELFTVADLSTVWVDFQVYRQDFARLRAGQCAWIICRPAPKPIRKACWRGPFSRTPTVPGRPDCSFAARPPSRNSRRFRYVWMRFSKCLRTLWAL